MKNLCRGNHLRLNQQVSAAFCVLFLVFVPSRPSFSSCLYNSLCQSRLLDISSHLYMCVVTNMWCEGHVKSPIRNIFAEKTLMFSVLICPTVFSCHFSLLLQWQRKRRLSLHDLLDKPQAIQSSWLKKRSSASSVLAFLELSIGHMCFAYAARLEDTGTQTKGQKNNMARLCSSFRSSERDHFNESDNEVWEKDAAQNRKKQYWRGSSDSNKALNAVDCGVPAGSVFVRRWHCTHPPATYRDIIIMLALFEMNYEKWAHLEVLHMPGACWGRTVLNGGWCPNGNSAWQFLHVTKQHRADSADLMDLNIACKHTAARKIQTVLLLSLCFLIVLSPQTSERNEEDKVSDSAEHGWVSCSRVS